MLQKKAALVRLLKQSTKAVCGITEREITVPSRLKAVTLSKLKNAGYRIVGTSYNDKGTTKIWFIARGGF